MSKTLYRGNRSVWMAVASIIASCALASVASAQVTITESASAPSLNILTSQLTNLGPGAKDSGRDYSDNGGPVGQTFQVSANATMGSFTVMGRGDSASSWTTGPNPMVNEVFGTMVGLVNTADNSVTTLYSDTGTFSANANVADFVTFNLGAGVPLVAGNTYVFSLYSGGANTWFGLAHTDTDVYAGGTQINMNSSNANPGGNAGGNRRTFAGNGFAAPNPSGGDLVFCVNAAPVPEPTSLALVGGLGLLSLAMRRRRA